MKPYGPDYEDPSLIDLAEYIWSLETNEGCMAEFLKDHNLNAEDFTKYDPRVEEIKEKHGLSLHDFYSDEWRDVRYSKMDEVYQERD